MIVDGIHMVPSIVPRVRAFIAYAAGQGWTVRIAHPYGGYRTLAEQAQLSGTGNAASSIPVAKPGYSTHGVYDVGRVDFVGVDGFTYSAALLAWIVANAAQFGLVREFGARDPNHFMASGAFAGDNIRPITTTEEEEDDMALRGITWTGDSDGVSYAAQYDTSSGFFSTVSGTQALYNAMNAAQIPFFATTESHANAIKASCEALLAAHASPQTADVSAIAAAVAGSVPTAAQNGAAARAAIVK